MKPTYKPKYKPGEKVVLFGLNDHPEFNNCEATIKNDVPMDAFNCKSGVGYYLKEKIYGLYPYFQERLIRKTELLPVINHYRNEE